MLHTLSDIHAHAVFDVDDGSLDLKMSLALLRLAQREGICDMACTSHNWGTLKNYHRNFNTLKQAAKEADILINLYPGCEVHCRKQDLPSLISALNSDSLPTINHTPYVLLEFSPGDLPEDILLCIKLLKANTNKKFIIAHVERYRHLARHTDAVDQLQSMGCLLQTNAYNLVREKHPEVLRFARKLIKEKRITFLGSDCHRIHHRPPAVQEGLRYIHEHCDANYAQAICRYNAQDTLFYRTSKQHI